MTEPDHAQSVAAARRVLAAAGLLTRIAGESPAPRVWSCPLTLTENDLRAHLRTFHATAPASTLHVYRQHADLHAGRARHDDLAAAVFHDHRSEVQP